MGTRLAGLLGKEIIQFMRDRVMLILILWLYTAEVIICVFALSLDVKNLPLAVADRDMSPASRALTQSLYVSDVFVPAGITNSMAEAAGWLDAGRVRAVVIVPDGFEEQLARDSRPAVQVLVDGTDSNTAAQVRAHVIEIVNRLDMSAHNARGKRPGVVPILRVWYNNDLSFTPFVVLSMIALAAFMVGIIHPAASIVREKEVGTIEQLRVTPISVGELFVAKTFPTLTIGLASVFPSLLIAWWFNVPFRGSMTLFLSLTALFLVTAIALGVLISAVTRTLQQALLLSFFGLFPLMFLSGTIVPVESMPDALQTISLASPLRHYMDVILGIFLKGSGLAELWPATAALVAIAVPLFTSAALIFRRGWV